MNLRHALVVVTCCLSALGTTVRAAAQRDPAPAAAIATVRVSAVRQPIYGFGGSQTYNGDLLAGFANREAVYKALFADLKLDILRLRNYDGYRGQEAGFDAKTREFAMAALRWSDPKERGGKGPVRLMFTSWSPPADLKSNHLVSGRSDGTDKGLENATLKRDSDGHYAYGAFADWWLASLRKFKELSGGYPDYIALQNELDIAVAYEGCEFLPREGTGKGGFSFAGYDQALAAVSDRLRSALGDQAPKIVGPETFTIRMDSNSKSHVQNYADPTTESGKAVLARLFGLLSYLRIGRRIAGPTRLPRAAREPAADLPGGRRRQTPLPDRVHRGRDAHVAGRNYPRYAHHRRSERLPRLDTRPERQPAGLRDGLLQSVRRQRRTARAVLRSEALFCVRRRGVESNRR